MLTIVNFVILEIAHTLLGRIAGIAIVDQFALVIEGQVAWPGRHNGLCVGVIVGRLLRTGVILQVVGACVESMESKSFLLNDCKSLAYHY